MIRLSCEQVIAGLCLALLVTDSQMNAVFLLAQRPMIIRRVAVFSAGDDERCPRPFAFGDARRRLTSEESKYGCATACMLMAGRAVKKWWWWPSVSVLIPCAKICRGGV